MLAPGWVNVESAPWSALNRALTPLYLALVLAGLGVAARRTRMRPLAAAAVVLLLGAGYFALLVKDPWSGERGHTWNLFKLAQWGWPIVLLLASLAVRRLAPRRPPWRPAALALAAFLPASQVGVHWPWGDAFGEAMREILPGVTLQQLPALKQRLQDLPPGTLLVMGRPANAHRWLGTAVSLLTWPRAVVADWVDGASISNHPLGGEAVYQQLLERWRDPHVVPILAGYVAFQPEGSEPLGGGFARVLKQDLPLIVHVVNPAGLKSDAAGRPAFEVGKGRTKLVVFSPSAGPASLSITLAPYPGRPGSRLVAFVSAEDYSHRAVRLASEGTPAAAIPVSGATGARGSARFAGGAQHRGAGVGRGARRARRPLASHSHRAAPFRPIRSHPPAALSTRRPLGRVRARKVDCSAA